jgi:2-polyprenyl-3-methyl-5-hydroxy-6-metoxy-1,4-benzoquinol methylase
MEVCKLENNLTVEQVMKKLRDYVKGTDISNKPAESENIFEPFNTTNLLKSREENNTNWNIKTEFQPRSYKKFIGRFIVFYKKFLRKSLRWYINPIVDQQNLFNGSATRSINEICNILQVVKQRLIDLERENHTIKAIMNSIEEKAENGLIKANMLDEKINIKDSQFYDLINTFKEKYKDFDEMLSKKEEELGYIREKLNEGYEQVSELINKVSDIDEKVTNLNNKAQEMENHIDSIKSLDEVIKEVSSNKETDIKDNLEQTIINIKEENRKIVNELLSENTFLSARLRRLERRLLQGTEPEKTERKQIVSNNINDFDYFLFEHRFRGPEYQIKENSKIFVEYFTGKSDVLDIGCGRGEFLELLNENGISAKGIDINEDFVFHCQDKGLNVQKIDAIEYLESLPDNSLGGIFISHVVEHLDNNYINNLIGLCYSKLTKGSFIVITTPNPRTLAILTHAFFTDPSHIRPMHPETLKFLLEGAGFQNVEEKHYGYSKVNYKIPLLDGEHISNLSDFNDSINVLNEILFGYEDYTIIAKK